MFYTNNEINNTEIFASNVNQCKFQNEITDINFNLHNSVGTINLRIFAYYITDIIDLFHVICNVIR